MKPNLVDQTCELLKWLCNYWKLHNTTTRQQFWQYSLLLVSNQSSDVVKWSLRGTHTTLTVHKPSKGMTSWNRFAWLYHQSVALGLVKSGNTVVPGQTYTLSSSFNDKNQTNSNEEETAIWATLSTDREMAVTFMLKKRDTCNKENNSWNNKDIHTINRQIAPQYYRAKSSDNPQYFCTFPDE